MNRDRNSQLGKLIVNNSTAVAKRPIIHIPGIQIKKLLVKLNYWRLKRSHRNYLLKLPDYLLDDIGITRQQLMEDTKRPFWEKGLFD